MRRLGHAAYMMWKIKMYTRIWFGKPKLLRERAKRIRKDNIKIVVKMQGVQGCGLLLFPSE